MVNFLCLILYKYKTYQMDSCFLCRTHSTDMDSKKIEQMLDMIDYLKSQADGLRSQANAVVRNDQENKNNEKTRVSPTLKAHCQSPDARNVSHSEYYDIKLMLRPLFDK